MLARQITFPHAPNQANSFVPMPLRPLEVSRLSFLQYSSFVFNGLQPLSSKHLGWGHLPLRRDVRPSCLRTFNRFITPFPATHPSRAKLRGEDSPVSPFFATHPKIGGTPANLMTSDNNDHAEWGERPDSRHYAPWTASRLRTATLPPSDCSISSSVRPLVSGTR